MVCQLDYFIVLIRKQNIPKELEFLLREARHYLVRTCLVLHILRIFILGKGLCQSHSLLEHQSQLHDCDATKIKRLSETVKSPPEPHFSEEIGMSRVLPQTRAHKTPLYLLILPVLGVVGLLSSLKIPLLLIRHAFYENKQDIKPSQEQI